MYSIILNVQIVVSVFLIIVVLLQNKNVSLNLTSMWGWMWEVTKRGTEKVLHNTTLVLGTLFVVNAVALFILG